MKNKIRFFVFFLSTIIALLIFWLLFKKNEVFNCQWNGLNVIKISNVFFNAKENVFITKDDQGNIWHKVRIRIGRENYSDVSDFLDYLMMKNLDGSNEPYFYHLQNLRPAIGGFYCANICKIYDFTILDEFMTNKSETLELSLTSMDITDVVLNFLSHYKGIVVLKLFSCNLQSSLKIKQDYVTHLKFASMDLCDNISMFADCNIKSFAAEDCKIDKHALNALSSFENVEQLSFELINPKLTPDDLRCLNKMQNLKHLKLNSALDDSVSEYDFTSNKSIETLTITIKQTGDGKIPEIKVNPNCNLELNREVAPN